MMDERFSLDTDPDMTNHQENCTHTKVEVSQALLGIILCVFIWFSQSCLAFNMWFKFGLFDLAY